MGERTSPREPVTVRVGAALDVYLDQALDIPIAQSDVWLQELAAREPNIATEVRRLLDAQAATRFDSFLNEPVVPRAQAYTPAVLS